MARKSKRVPEMAQELPKTADQYSVAIYLRLSIEEKRDRKDSESIEYQKQICFAYLQDKPNMIVYNVYIDNGETGTNFEREQFQRMMYDLYNGKINCIIVKDLSRFGREYVEMGDYIEKLFPLLGVRFIAINDRVDNKVAPLDISVPIKNVINSMYAKDLSKKSASALRMKQLKGEYIGGPAPYGYLKSPEDKHKLVIDPEAAEVVRLIFHLKQKKMGNMAIARRLFEMGIPTPRRHLYDLGIAKSDKYAASKYWCDGTIKNILRSEIYIGNMAQGKTKSHFFNGGPLETVDRENWVVVENTHEAIIPKEVFYEVRQIMQEQQDEYWKSHRHSRSSEGTNIFKGKVVCGECGSKAKRLKNAYHAKPIYYYACSQHYTYPDSCDVLSVKEDVLKSVVLKSIKVQMSAIIGFEITLKQALNSPEWKQGMLDLSGKISQTLSNILYIKAGRLSLTSDLSKGILDETEYVLARDELQAELQNEMDTLEQLNRMRKRYNKLLDAEKWVAELKKYSAAKKLNAEIVNAFVKQIRLYSGKQIEIVWKYEECFSEYTSMLQGGAKLAG